LIPNRYLIESESEVSEYQTTDHYEFLSPPLTKATYETSRKELTTKLGDNYLDFIMDIEEEEEEEESEDEFEFTPSPTVATPPRITRRQRQRPTETIDETCHDFDFIPIIKKKKKKVIPIGSEDEDDDADDDDEEEEEKKNLI
jgi:hypothetical protein